MSKWDLTIRVLSAPFVLMGGVAAFACYGFLLGWNAARLDAGRWAR